MVGEIGISGMTVQCTLVPSSIYTPMEEDTRLINLQTPFLSVPGTFSDGATHM